MVPPLYTSVACRALAMEVKFMSLMDLEQSVSFSNHLPPTHMIQSGYLEPLVPLPAPSLLALFSRDRQIPSDCVLRKQGDTGSCKPGVPSVSWVPSRRHNDVQTFKA